VPPLYTVGRFPTCARSPTLAPKCVRPHPPTVQPKITGTVIRAPHSQDANHQHGQIRAPCWQRGTITATARAPQSSHQKARLVSLPPKAWHGSAPHALQRLDQDPKHQAVPARPRLRPDFGVLTIQHEVAVHALTCEPSGQHCPFDLMAQLRPRRAMATFP
jgi:hypothetical protein